ncbi:MAG: DUF4132 domain-containing protein [Paracoccaceae bacterium]|nr:DUF4132 domain-containing protein [Paracoccaceae bacterium]
MSGMLVCKTPDNPLLEEITEKLSEQGDSAFYWRLKEIAAYQTLKADKEMAAKMARYVFANRGILMPEPRVTKDGYREFFSLPSLEIFKGVMLGSLPIPAPELIDWLEALHVSAEQRGHKRFDDWPIAHMVQNIERAHKKTALAEADLHRLGAMLDWPELHVEPHLGPDLRKVAKRIRSMLAAAEGQDLSVVPYTQLGGDPFGDAVAADLAKQASEEAAKWHRVLNHASDAGPAKPPVKFSNATKDLRNAVGKEWLRRHLQDWFAKALVAKPEIITHRQSYTNNRTGEEHHFTTTESKLFTKPNATLLKGLVWTAEGLRDDKTVNLIADLCEKGMTKLPGLGPAAQSVANACLWYLEVTPGTQVTARLSRLGTAIKQKSTQAKVAELVRQKAETAGITTIQLEERVVPDYGLEAGKKTVGFDDYALRITVDGPGHVTQTWLKPDGTPQKSKPKVVSEKAALKTKLSKLQGEVKALKKVLIAQRDRMDRLFAEDLDWPISELQDYYIGHPLVGVLATRLIWSLTTGGVTTPALWRGGVWQDVTGAPVVVDDATRVRLWHPVEAGTDTVMAWRARLMALEIVQPTKQVFREVYLLTDAERTTRTYSNRMAAHMLKQHQMATLMAARGWRYSLMGAYDDGFDDSWATKSFVTSDLTVEYLIHKKWDDENWNDAGILLYVGTDQLRFTRWGVQVPLEDVPVRLLSETLREADLFVGVASVGNDPAWIDQGPTPEARLYWETYAFGDLDGFAETRKAVLDALIPRLKIRDVAHIEGKYLIVDGKLNTYKIHLGSSNILMAPGDRYLCIVAAGVPKAADVALPFEGDARLSVILSKAFMLAADDKITASDIVSQLKR